MGTNPRRREEPVTKRRTLRGKRRAKDKNISSEEQEMLASAMKCWLGNQNLGPEMHH